MPMSISVSMPNFSKVFFKEKMSSAGKGSDVWKYFSKATEKVGHVKCSICHSFLQYKDSSTSSMKKHLAGRHFIYITSKNNKTKSSS